MEKLSELILRLLAVRPKDDSPEAALSGDLDELPQTKKKKQPVDVEDATEDD